MVKILYFVLIISLGLGSLFIDISSGDNYVTCIDENGKKFIGNSGCPKNYKIKNTFSTGSKAGSDLRSCEKRCIAFWCAESKRWAEDKFRRTEGKIRWEGNNLVYNTSGDFVAKDENGRVIARGWEACIVLHSKVCIESNKKYDDDKCEWINRK